MSRCETVTFYVISGSKRIQRKNAADKLVTLESHNAVIVGKEDDNADNTLDDSGWDSTWRETSTFEESHNTQVTVIHRAGRNDSPNGSAYLAFPETATDISEKDTLALVRGTFGPNTRPLIIRSFVKVSDKTTQTSADVNYRRAEHIESESVDQGKAIERDVTKSSKIYIDKVYSFSYGNSTKSSVINDGAENEEEIVESQNHDKSDPYIHSDKTVHGIMDMSFTSIANEQSSVNTKYEVDAVDKEPIADKEPIEIVFKKPAEQREKPKESISDTISQMLAFNSVKQSTYILEDQKQRSAPTVNNDRDELYYNSEDSDKTEKLPSPTKWKHRNTSSESEEPKTWPRRSSSDFDNLKNSVEAPISLSDPPEMIQMRSAPTVNYDRDKLYNSEDSDKTEKLPSPTKRKHRSTSSESEEPKIWSKRSSSDIDNLKNSVEAPILLSDQPDVIQTRSAPTVNYDRDKLYNSDNSDKTEKLPSPTKRKHRSTSSESEEPKIWPRRGSSDFDNFKNSVEAPRSLNDQPDMIQKRSHTIVDYDRIDSYNSEDSDKIEKIPGPAKRKHRKTSSEIIDRKRRMNSDFDKLKNSVEAPAAPHDQPEIIQIRSSPIIDYNRIETLNSEDSDKTEKHPSTAKPKHQKTSLKKVDSERQQRRPSSDCDKLKSLVQVPTAASDHSAIIQTRYNLRKSSRRSSADEVAALSTKHRKPHSRRSSAVSLSASNQLRAFKLPQKSQRKISTEGDYLSKDCEADSTYRRGRRKSSEVDVRSPAKHKNVHSRRVSTESIQTSNNTLFVPGRLRESMPPQKLRQKVSFNFGERMSSKGDTPSKDGITNRNHLRSYWSAENTVFRITQAQKANIHPLNLTDLVKFSLNHDTDEDKPHGKMRDHLVAAFSTLIELRRLNLITMESLQENSFAVQNIKIGMSLNELFNK